MELFIGNLSFNTWETSLVSACGRFGEVIACRIARDKLGKHRGYGFVTFASETGALACLSGLRELEGRDLKVEIVANDKQSLPTAARSTPPLTPVMPTSASLQFPWADQQAQSAPAPLSTPATTNDAAFSIASHQVIVWNLSAEMTPQQLRQALSCFGPILDCIVCPLSPRIGNGAYGVVTFVDRLAATLAVSQSGVLEFDGQAITIQAVVPDPTNDVAPATTVPSPTGCTEIFVGNLSFETTLARLYATFAPYGVITDCRIPRFENGQPKGFGFVSYASRAAAETAIRNVSVLDGRPLKLEIATGHKRSWVDLQPPASAASHQQAAQQQQRKPPSPTNVPSNVSFSSTPGGNTPPGTPSPLLPLEELLSALSLASLVNNRPARPTATVPMPRAVVPQMQIPSLVSKNLFQELGELRGMSHEGGLYNPQDQCELFVGNLPFDATEAELNAAFSIYGLVTECRITVGLDGKPKGYGFVSFASAIDADVAARAMTELHGRTLNVQYAAAPRSGCAASAHAFAGWDRRSLMGVAL